MQGTHGSYSKEPHYVVARALANAIHVKKNISQVHTTLLRTCLHMLLQLLLNTTVNILFYPLRWCELLILICIYKMVCKEEPCRYKSRRCKKLVLAWRSWWLELVLSKVQIRPFNTRTSYNVKICQYIYIEIYWIFVAI